jgi:putative glutamine amidotransferase
MNNPIIGVTTYQGENYQNLPIIALLRAYVEALITAGATPVLIPSNLTSRNWMDLYQHLDGILFTGGGDISPNQYTNDATPVIKDVDLERDEIEFQILESLLHDNKPFLGICRGFQVIVVRMGGTLYSHLPDQFTGALKHDFYPDFPRNHPAHAVRILRGTKISSIIGEEEFIVNSLHHQGAKVIPNNLTVAATAPDGLVEAVELADHRFGVGVQWHPEWLNDQPASRKLFTAFVHASGVKT